MKNNNLILALLFFTGSAYAAHNTQKTHLGAIAPVSYNHNKWLVLLTSVHNNGQYDLVTTQNDHQVTYTGMHKTFVTETSGVYGIPPCLCQEGEYTYQQIAQFKKNALHYFENKQKKDAFHVKQTQNDYVRIFPVKVNHISIKVINHLSQTGHLQWVPVSALKNLTGNGPEDIKLGKQTLIINNTVVKAIKSQKFLPLKRND